MYNIEIVLCKQKLNIFEKRYASNEGKKKREKKFLLTQGGVTGGVRERWRRRRPLEEEEEEVGSRKLRTHLQLRWEVVME